VSPLRRRLPALRIMTRRRKGHKCTVFVAGLNGKWTTWLPLLRAMVTLGVDPGAIFVLDFSGTRFPSTVADLDDVCKHVLAFVSAAGYEELHVVGHSTGGCLATFMATLVSEDVQVTNLYSVSGIFVSLFDAAHLSLLPALWFGGGARSLAELRLLAKAGPVATFGLRRIAKSDALTRSVLAGLYSHPDDVPAGEVQSTLQAFNVRTLQDTLDIGVAYDYRAIYPRVRANVRLVVGDCDPLVTAEDARRAEGLLPHLSACLLKDTGHFAHLERPVETATQFYLE